MDYDDPSWSAETRFKIQRLRDEIQKQKKETERFRKEAAKLQKQREVRNKLLVTPRLLPARPGMEY